MAKNKQFIEVKGKGLDKLSDIFVNYGKSIPDISNEVLDKYKNAPYRAPMIIILVNSYKEHPKVPAIEQKLSSNCCTKYYASIKCNGIFLYMENWKNGIQ